MHLHATDAALCNDSHARLRRPRPWPMWVATQTHSHSHAPAGRTGWRRTATTPPPRRALCLTSSPLGPAGMQGAWVFQTQRSASWVCVREDMYRMCLCVCACGAAPRPLPRLKTQPHGCECDALAGFRHPHRQMAMPMELVNTARSEGEGARPPWGTGPEGAITSHSHAMVKANCTEWHVLNSAAYWYPLRACPPCLHRGYQPGAPSHVA